jgi:hypothetical protein
MLLAGKGDDGGGMARGGHMAGQDVKTGFLGKTTIDPELPTLNLNGLRDRADGSP